MFTYSRTTWGKIKSIVNGSQGTNRMLERKNGKIEEKRKMVRLLRTLNISYILAFLSPFVKLFLYFFYYSFFFVLFKM